MSGVRTYSRPVRLPAIGFLLFLLAIGAFFPAFGGEPPEKKTNVLLLVSYHETHVWTRTLYDTIVRELPDVAFTPVSFDMMRESEPEQWKKKLFRYLDSVAAGKYDMIVTMDAPVTDLLFACAEKIPVRTPVVFVGYEHSPAELRKKHANTTGVTQSCRGGKTLATGLALYPDTRTVLVLSDNSGESRIFDRRIKAKAEEFPEINFQFVSTDGSDLKQILERVQKLPEDSLVLLSPWRGLGGNDYQTLGSFGTDLQSYAKRPYLVSNVGFFGSGALGGYVSDPHEHGHVLAGLIREVKRGGDAARTPIMDGRLVPMFDWNMLRENRLDPSILPPDTVFLNRPPALWNYYRNAFLIGLAFLLLSATSVFFYVRLSRRYLRHLRDVLLSIPGRIGVVNEAEKILFVSARDLADSEVAAIKTLADVPNSDYEKVSTTFRKVFEDGVTRMLEYESKGTKRVMFISAVQPKIFGEKAVIWFSHDNAELQNTRLSLRDLLERYSLLLDNMPAYVLTKDIQNDFRYISCNRYCATMMNCSATDVIGKNDFELFMAPGEAEVFRRDDTDAVAAGSETVVARSFSDTAGRVHHGKFYRKIMDTPAGKQLFVLVTDITDVENAKRRAEENSEWFRLTLNSIGDGVITTDKAGIVTMINPVAERMLGVPLADALGRPHEQIFKIVSYDDDLPSPSPVTRTLRTGAIVELANHTDLISRNGARYHISDSASPILDADRNILGAILVFRDVTDEYMHRDQMRRMLALLEAGSKNSKSAMFLYHKETGAISGSGMLPELLPVQDGALADMKEWVGEDDLPETRRKWADLVAGKKESENFDFRFDRDGEVHYFRMHIDVDCGDPRDTVFTGAIQDITDVRQTFERLQEQENIWELVINSIPVMFFAKDATRDFRYALCNQAFCEFVGKSAGEIIGKTDAELFNRPADVEHFRACDAAVMETSNGENFSEEVVGGNGTVRLFQTVKKPFSGRNSRLLLAASSDITEERKLLTSERMNSEILAAAAENKGLEILLTRMADILLERLECDRVMLTACNAEGLLRLSHEWLSPGMESIRNLDLEKHYAVWDANIGMMRDNRVLQIADMVQSEFDRELSQNGRYNTRSLTVSPVFVDGVLWGALFISFSRMRHEFNEADERIMRTCANVISVAIIGDSQKKAIAATERMHSLILDNIHIPIWLHDTFGSLVSANTAAEMLLGVAGDALTTQKNREILAPAFGHGVEQPIEETLRTGKSVTREMKLSGREYIVTSEPVFNDGNLAYIVKTAVDMTDFNILFHAQKAMRNCLETLLGEPCLEKAVEQTLRNVSEYLGASRSYVFRLDEEKRTMSSFVEYVPDGAVPIFGNVKDKPFTSSPSWLDRFKTEQTVFVVDLHECPIDEYGKGWHDAVMKYDMRSIYGTRLLADSRLCGYLGVVYEHKTRELDAESVKFMQAVAHFIEVMLVRSIDRSELLAALKKAENADRAKSFFIASVSHEIRTPLNAVIGFTELLKDETLDARTRAEYLDSIHYSSDALLQLINDVLDLSKLEADQMEIIPEPADFRELGEEVMRVFALSASRKNLELKVEIPEIPLLLLDKMRVRQILFNLIGNAVKFTPQGSVTLWADFRLTGGNTGQFRFAVSDTGIGINSKDQERLLEPFVQLSRLRGTNAANNGTGLGLSICKRLAEKMGGKIWVDSTPEKGSTFGILLFNVSVAHPHFPQKDAALPLTEAAPPLSVLLVDDVELNLKVMKAMCLKAGISDVVTALNAETALEILKQRSFDMVMTDMWMPGMNGSELAAAIRSDHRFDAMPVIAVTADSEAKDNFPLKNFTGILLKPVTLDKINKMIHIARKAEVKV